MKIFSVIVRLISIIILPFIIAQECYDDGAEFCIYPEDILSTDLLPDSFLTVGQNSQYSKNSSGDQKIPGNGTIDEAFNAMGFHRKKMNEFLCHGFLAEQILTEVGGARVKRRLDVSLENSLLEYNGDGNVSIHEKLLFDEGSSKYKDWLKKSTTLDDVYRHYAPRSKSPKPRKKESVDRRHDDEGEGYDGEVTGFAMPTGKVGGYFGAPEEDHFSAPSGQHFTHHADYVDHQPDFYPQIHEEHIFLPNHDNYHHQDHHEEHHRPSYHHHHHHGKGKGHELSLRDFFEITLTALAFLAFGLFIAQLLMNVTNTATTTSAAFLQADIDGTRFKRNALPPFISSSPLGYSGNEELNELSHRVLRSVEAGLAAEFDGGNCLRRVLCEYNKISKESNGGQRIWMPVWSLGMSWFSGRILRKTTWSSTLASLKATVLGIGGADCAALFPDCNLSQEVTKSRRRRRRRRK